jgi:uncharacterized membrane protein
MKKIPQLIVARPRMTLSVLLGCAALVLTPTAWSGLDRVLTAWNVATWIYLLALWVLMIRATPERIRHIARLQDESAIKVLVTVCLAAIMSLVAIVFELAGARGVPLDVRLGHLGLSALTLLGTWLLLPTLFAMHYAHQYYGSSASARSLLFPDRPTTPNYWDFAYFSFTIAVASQTADIAPNNGATRRLVLAQSMLAFVFNTSILAMSINVAASLVG